MTQFELAQVNIATMKTSLESPEMADFVANLDKINALAEQSPGFIWRLQTEEGDATALRPLGDKVLFNMSVWSSIHALHNYVYRSAHAEIMKRRKEWFEQMQEAYTVLWWTKKEVRPSITEAISKIEQLRKLGPTPEAFTFKHHFPEPTSLI